MKTAGDVLRSKGNAIHSVTASSTVFDALTLMAEKNIGAVLVIEQDGAIAGVFSERDYARKITLRNLTSRKTPVADVMTRNVVFVPTTRTIDECMALMTDKRIRHLPVLEGPKLIGVLSIGDVVKAVIAEKDFIIEQIEQYISGSM
jgi:CBS domain-containing protein